MTAPDAPRPGRRANFSPAPADSGWRVRLPSGTPMERVHADEQGALDELDALFPGDRPAGYWGGRVVWDAGAQSGPQGHGERQDG